MKTIKSIGAAVVMGAFLCVASAKDGDVIGITFGDGTQGPSPSVAAGPVVQSANWNNVAVHPWDWTSGNDPPNGHYWWIICKTDGKGPGLSYPTGEATDVATHDSKGLALGANIQIFLHDPGAPLSYQNYGGLPSWRTGSTGRSDVYATQKVVYNTANQYGQVVPSTLTISNIPYRKYTLYVGASNLTLNNTLINGDSIFPNLSASSLVFSTQDPNPGGGSSGSLSYLQIVVPVKGSLFLVR